MNILPALEGISYASTFGLLIVAIIGLKQLTISKDQSRLNSKRDSFKLANEQVRYYADAVIPVINRLDVRIAEKEVTFLEKSKFELLEDRVELHLNPQDSKEVMRQVRLIIEPVAEAMNKLECFATYFTSELADETVAFRAVAETYCNTVERLMPIIVLAGRRHTYQDIIELYRVWKARIETESLESQKSEIEKKLASAKDTRIIPLGTAEKGD